MRFAGSSRETLHLRHLQCKHIIFAIFNRVIYPLDFVHNTYQRSINHFCAIIYRIVYCKCNTVIFISIWYSTYSAIILMLLFATPFIPLPLLVSSSDNTYMCVPCLHLLVLGQNAIITIILWHLWYHIIPPSILSEVYVFHIICSIDL
jgi:hypothetical protein